MESHIRHFMANAGLESYDQLKKMFERMYEHGKGNPEEVLEKFGLLHENIQFCLAPTVELTLSRLKNRDVLYRFYDFCFNLPVFGHFDRDDRMRRNLEAEGFEIVYENYKPVRIVDTRKETP